MVFILEKKIALISRKNVLFIINSFFNFQTRGRKYDGSERVHEGSELQSMIASPTMNGGVNHHQPSTKLTTNSSENA